MQAANEEITKKKALVQNLLVKYPELRINTEAIIKCGAEEVERLV
jgi:hypothetical protein